MQTKSSKAIGHSGNRIDLITAECAVALVENLRIDHQRLSQRSSMFWSYSEGFKTLGDAHAERVCIREALQCNTWAAEKTREAVDLIEEYGISCPLEFKAGLEMSRTLWKVAEKERKIKPAPVGEGMLDDGDDRAGKER